LKTRTGCVTAIHVRRSGHDEDESRAVPPFTSVPVLISFRKDKLYDRDSSFKFTKKKERFIIQTWKQQEWYNYSITDQSISVYMTSGTRGPFTLAMLIITDTKEWCKLKLVQQDLRTLVGTAEPPCSGTTERMV
jgi:hypothetical protein